jgi:hypothetical protein
MDYKKLNTYTGWLVFLIATTAYFITIEDTVSLWDCGEYITAAYKLEVGHPPGAPLFMLLGRIFSFFAAPENVAVWINRMSGLSSSFSILFMFWSITMLAKKMALNNKRTLSKGEIIAILGSGAVGALAYTFTDSFWFSAVEGEVYAMSSLFTAIIFWAILKWDEETEAIKFGELDLDVSPLRWMILIMFLFGLAIGVHLLGLLVIPSIAYVIYFNQTAKFSWKGFFITGIVSIFTLGFIQEGIIPGTISLASKFEIAFVNSMGMPFYIGSLFFFVLLIIGSIFLVRWSKKNDKPILNAAALGFIVFLIGYGSFATIVIRSSANTPLDENDPENLVTLHSYLKREQYGSWPIASGPYWNSKVDEDQSKWGDRSKFYARRFVVTRGEQDLKAFRAESDAKKHAKTLGNGHEVIEKYYVTNDGYRENQEPVYAQNTFFPRMYWSQDQVKIDAYKSWSGYNEAEDKGTDIGNDGKRLPSFGENLTYFARYQINWMYWRYFMWNFAGRQNDIQGHGDAIRGNWLTGFSSIDKEHLGAQGIDAPTFTTNNESNNKFYLFPLILAVIGMVFHFYRAPKDAFIVLLSFIFTGLAIVIYLNQKPFEPRERDYAYAASFYMFAIWIGLSVFALFEMSKSFTKLELKRTGIIAAGGLVFFFIIDRMGGGFTASLSWLYISVIAGALIGIMHLLGKKSKNETQGAYAAIAIAAIAPLLLAVQGWDDHDRSEKTSARDLAYNYLESCAKNAIIFTNGDNDTFPLWYLQEVEEKRTDVRVCNLSLMQTDWYTDQMKMKAYTSEPLPIKFREDQIMMYAGNTDQVYFLSMLDLMNAGVPKEALKKIYTSKIKYNKAAFQEAFSQFQENAAMVANTIKSKTPEAQANIDAIRSKISTPAATPTYSDVDRVMTASLEILMGYSNGMIDAPQEMLQQFQTTLKDWEKSWDYLPMDIAMEFVRDDKNQIDNSGHKLRVFPSRGFILPVNKKNAIASGIVAKTDAERIPAEIRFSIEEQALTREQVMMLDILANNDWKRPIYFSSPGGSNVSIALYQRGYVKQNGIAYEFTPVVDRNPIDKEKMYKNLTKVYDFGKMNKKGVLTDYYTRRHTSQYRDQFIRLAEAYLNEADELKNGKIQFPGQINELRSAGQTKTADSLQNVLKNADKTIADNKKKAIELIERSINVMPISNVIDYGEPNPGNANFELAPGVTFEGYSDGTLHEYVGILYRAGNKAKANKLAGEVATHIESILNYFEKSNASFAYNNKPDLISALNNYMIVATYTADAEIGDKNSVVAKRLNAKINALYKVVFPRIYSDLSVEGKERVEIEKLKNHIEAIGVKYGFRARPANISAPTTQDNFTPEQLQQMMQQMQ